VTVSAKDKGEDEKVGKSDPIIYTLEQALDKGKCPVCCCLATATTRSLANLLYEFVNDPTTRDHLRASGGFCREHSWALQQMGDPLAHSIIYADLIDGFCVKLQENMKESRSGPAFLAEKEEPCPVCLDEAETEKRYLDGLLKAIHTSAFQEKYRKLGFLCRPHFQAVYSQTRDGKVRSFLTEVQLEELSRLSAELKEFIRKSDYRYAGELPGTERDAWIRAVRSWVGPNDLKTN
jgi:hypothetical protein